MMQNKKSLGQHWLKNRVILEEIAELAAGGVIGDDIDVKGGAQEIAEKTGVETVKTCVEIGPGLGTLTSSLFRRFERVVAVEYDAELAAKLPGQFPGKNLTVINEDILKFDFGEVGEPYAVAGNIPYYITSPIIERILKAEHQPERAVLLMQKEVAERIVSERESVLSLMCKNLAEVRLGPVVLAEEFTPPPQVDSQVLVLIPHTPTVPEEVFKLIRLGFVAPRKKLIHNLEAIRGKEELRDMFLRLKINVDARPADLKLMDWWNLYQKMYELVI